MEGLLSFLIFGGLFFMMMRYGCGAHVIHGGHGQAGKSDVGKTNHIDPVCSMVMDSHMGYGKVHEGHLYRFCSRACLDKFDAEPARYTNVKRLEDKS